MGGKYIFLYYTIFRKINPEIILVIFSVPFYFSPNKIIVGLGQIRQTFDHSRITEKLEEHIV